MDLHLGLRPIKLYPRVPTPLRLGEGERIDYAILRENTERLGASTTSDKSNVFKSYAFFREVFDEVAASYPETQAEHVYVDAMTMYLIQLRTLVRLAA